MGFISEKVGNQIIVRHALAPIAFEPMSLDEWIAFRREQAHNAIETARHKARRAYPGDFERDYASYDTDAESRQRVNRLFKEANQSMYDIQQACERDIEDMQKQFAKTRVSK